MIDIAAYCHKHAVVVESFSSNVTLYHTVDGCVSNKRNVDICDIPRFPKRTVQLVCKNMDFCKGL